MKKFLSFAFGLLFLVTPVFADYPKMNEENLRSEGVTNAQAWQYYASTVRVYVQGRKKECTTSSCKIYTDRSGGSATVVDCYESDKGNIVAVAISCDHIFYDFIDTPTVTVETFWPTYGTYAAIIAGRDQKNDVSILAFAVPKAVVYTLVAIAAETPNIGDRVCILGCPALDGKTMSEPKGFFATVTEFTKCPWGPPLNSRRFEIDYQILNGNSGGGVFRNGRLIGVAVARWDGDKKTSQIVSTELVRKAYDDIFVDCNNPTCLKMFGCRKKAGVDKQAPYVNPPDGQPDEPTVRQPEARESPAPTPTPQSSTEDAFKTFSVFSGLGAAATTAFLFYRKVKAA